MSEKTFMSPTKRKELMKEVEHRREVLSKQIRSVAQGYTTAAFIYGPGGLGKTHAITRELAGLCGKSWVHHTAFTTPKGLMLSLMAAPDMTHLFEDCESMYKAQVSAEILRAACGSPKDAIRRVTYRTAHESLECRFTGGIIIVSNESLKLSKGPLQAVASRFKPWKWDLTLNERIACILEIADMGWDQNGMSLTVADCRKVAAFLLEEQRNNALTSPLDLRMLTEHCFPAYAQYLDDPTGAGWKDVIRAKLAGEIETPMNRAEKTANLEALAWRIYCDQALVGVKAKSAKWTAETGLGQAIYYRHLAAAKVRWQAAQPSKSRAMILHPSKGE